MTLWIVSGAVTILLLFIIGMLYWFIRKLLFDLDAASEEVDEILVQLKHFSSHITSVHELPMFYGDETLQSLITHSRELVERIGVFVEKYSVLIPEEEVEEIEEHEETTED